MQPHHIQSSDINLRLDKWCKENLPNISFGLLQKAMRKGMIKVNGSKVTPDYRLQDGDVVTAADSLHQTSAPIAKPEKKGVSVAQLEEIKSWVIFEDEHIIAINKPAGIAVQGGTGINDCIDTRLDAFCESPDSPRPKLVHRLDRDTSGILLLAKNKTSAADLTAAFRHKFAQKIYWAIVMGIPEQQVGTIDLPLAKRNVGSGLEKMSVVIDDSGDEAITHFRIIKTNERYGISWLECMPITGRTHQIRVHLQAIGHPVYGDGKYGGRDAFHHRLELPKQLHLHSRQLNLTDPRKYNFKAQAPEHFIQSFEKLGWSAQDDGVSLLDIF